MRDITDITRAGKKSFAKAARLKPRAYRRNAAGYFAFTIKCAEGSRLVRIGLEGQKVVAECVGVEHGDHCKGLKFSGHCFHLCAALLVVGRSLLTNSKTQ